MLDVFESFVHRTDQTLQRVIKMLEQVVPLYPAVKEKIISSILHKIQTVEQSHFGTDDQLRRVNAFIRQTCINFR